ncbi:MAG TPA: DNA polymerase III subunit delta [Burkholderiales bacterium]|nr:DNA polymerase III subunit delta [Burkholderiales bacterium]
MPQLRSDQLDAHLARGLASLYVVHGDEPLLSMEAADAIRAKARAEGYAEREVHLVERGYDWSRLAQSAAALSLFSSRKLIELRVPSGKPGTDGAEAIAAYCATLQPDIVTVVALPRLDRAGQNSAWFGALAGAGVVVNVFPVDRRTLPLWIGARLARQKQRASEDALAFVADCVEGNLLAAHQEIQKLGLLYPPGDLAFEQVRDAVLDVARFEVSQLSEAMLSGDRARLARVLDGLAGEGEAPPRVLWVMSDDVRAVTRVQRGLAEGRSPADLCRESRVWGEARQRLVTAAARRMAREALDAALAHAAAVDRTIKGLAKGDPWDELLQLGLRFA